MSQLIKCVRPILFATAVVAIAMASVSVSLAADSWGSIKGRIILKGAPPAPVQIVVDKDKGVCDKNPQVDESVVVGKGGELANVFVYSRSKGLAVHSDYEKTAKDSIELDNKFCRYTPRCSVLRTTQTLVLKNTDTVAHNVKADLFKNTSFNILIPPKNEVPKEFPEAETLPINVGCSIHSWMAGFVLIRDDPYMTVSAEDGTFEIKNLPVGEVEIQLWQEKSGYLDEALVQGKPAKKGRFKLNIKPGVLDLGDIVVDAKIFKGK